MFKHVFHSWYGDLDSKYMIHNHNSCDVDFIIIMFFF